MSGKRTYTIPVLLLICTVLTTLIIVSYSSLLLNKQADKLDRGKRLADSYGECLAYADLLASGSADLAQSAQAVDRLAVKQRLGQIPPLSGECASALSEAGVLSGQAQDQAAAAVSAPMQDVWNKLEPIGNHDGPLTDAERSVLKTIGDAAAKLGATLRQYDIPTGNDRFRQMAAGADWVDPARQAVQQLQELADALK